VRFSSCDAFSSASLLKHGIDACAYVDKWILIDTSQYTGLHINYQITHEQCSAFAAFLRGSCALQIALIIIIIM